MPAHASSRRWTAAEVRALIDETRPSPRYELIDGELLVTPSPRWLHQRAVARLWRALDDFVRPRALGEALLSPADLGLEPESVLQPDVFVVPADVLRNPPAWTDVNRLLLAIEILSPSSARYDRVTKRRYYQRNGVPEYWVIDLDARVVERWTPDHFRPEILDRTLAWQPEGASEPLEIDLPRFFADVMGDVGDGAAPDSEIR